MHADPPGRLILGDNLTAMRALADASVDLIATDPPFFTGRHHATEPKPEGEGGAFSDIWDGGIAAYLAWLEPRLVEMRRLLRPHGTLWLHLDWHAVHHVRVLCDRVFGAARFRNEVIWAYGASARGAKAVAGHLPRNHDTLLVYARGPRPVYHPIIEERLLTFAQARRAGYRVDEDGRPFKTAPRGDYTDASIERLRAEGRIFATATGRIRVKYFLEQRDGCVVERRALGDVWTGIPDAMHLGHERLGYPTQKPEALLERIIRCASDPGAVVADPFCGSGTTAAVAARLGRRWLACDNAEAAIRLTEARLRAAGHDGYLVEHVASDHEAPALT